MKCKQCKKEFTQTHGSQRYCCPECSYDYYHKGKQLKICTVCDKEFTTNRHNQKYCSPECRDNGYNSNYRKVGQYLIFERDNFRCIYCGHTSYGDDAELHADHIVPKSKGGPDEAGNLVTSCIECNLTKHNNELQPKIVAVILEEVANRNKNCNIHPNLTIKFSLKR